MKVRRFFHIVLLSCLANLGLTAPSALSQPTITKQPADQSVSLGASVTNQVVVTGTAPFAYQWNFNDAPLTSATNRTLALTNVLSSAAGGYSVIVFDAAGSAATSRVAMISVDPTFFKITTGAIVTDRGDFQAAGWADYDNDGWQDLLVVNF